MKDSTEFEEGFALQMKNDGFIGVFGYNSLEKIVKIFSDFACIFIKIYYNIGMKIELELDQK